MLIYYDNDLWTTDDVYEGSYTEIKNINPCRVIRLKKYTNPDVETSTAISETESQWEHRC